MPCSFNLLAEMATVKSDRRTDKSCSIGSTGIFLLLVANCQFVGKFNIVDYLQWHSIDDKF